MSQASQGLWTAALCLQSLGSRRRTSMLGHGYFQPNLQDNVTQVVPCACLATKGSSRQKFQTHTSRELQPQCDIMKLFLCYCAKVNLMANRLTYKAAWIHSIHNNLQCSHTIAA